MRRSKRLRVLREVWAEMPAIDCKGLCWDGCSTVPVFPVELELLEKHAGRELATTELAYAGGRVVGLGSFGQPCPFLVLQRCTAREVRPTVCRAFGVVEGLRCPHGCTPTKLLTDEQQFLLFKRVELLG